MSRTAAPESTVATQGEAGPDERWISFVGPGAIRPVLHPYSDADRLQARILCYPMSELLSEKIRFLYRDVGLATYTTS